jgi:hypothetical protein
MRLEGLGKLNEKFNGLVGNLIVVKVKVLHVLNQGLCYEDAWGEWMYRSTFFLHRH